MLYLYLIDFWRDDSKLPRWGPKACNGDIQLPLNIMARVPLECKWM